MNRQDYRLVVDERPRQPRTGLWQKVTMASVATLLLIFAAVYGPLLFNNTPASATPALPDVGQVGTAAAPAFQMTDATLLDDQEALADLYSQVTPSVVNIQVSVRASGSGLFGFGNPQSDAPLQQSQGSGFIYDNEGHIVTNNHVVEDAEEITVIFHNGFWADGEVVATDPQADLAVVKVTPPQNFEWQALSMASPEEARVGHMVIAIGNPFGLAGTMTRGIVSAIGRGMPVGDDGASVRYTLPDVIQTDAAINPGNSGGPLLNLQGEVVGVNFAINSAVRSNSGVGFAIPSAIVQRVVPELIKDGAFEYAFLGVSGTTITPDVARQLDLPGHRLGVYVSGVTDGGPSEDAGLEGGDQIIEAEDGGRYSVGGDIITAIDDMPVRSFDDLVSFLVTRAAPGQTVSLTIDRDGASISVDVTLGERPGQQRLLRNTSTSGEVNARTAIEIATAYVEEESLLDGEIVEKVTTPDTRSGVDVWIVELSDSDEVATVVVEKASGEVLMANVN